MNKSAKTTILLSAFLILVVLTSSIYLMMPEKVRIDIEKTRTRFSVWENDSWELSATEYLYLWDGSTKMRAKSRDVSYFTSGNMTTVMRYSTWKDNITTIENYVFDSSISNEELFPIDHFVQCINCEGKIVSFEYRNILYDDQTEVITSPFSFGHNMKLTWEDGAYFSKVYQQKVASDKIIIKYRPNSDDVTYKVRLFDPEPEVVSTYTRGKEKHCKPLNSTHQTCDLTLYSGTRFADENGTKVENAKSLKGLWKVKYLKNDSVHIINIVDYNYSSITFNFSYDENSVNLSEYEYEIEDGKMKTKFKIIRINQSIIFNETTGFNQTILVEYEEEIEIEIEEEDNYFYTLNENPLGKKFKLGDNSTEISLQDADSENLADLSIRDAGLDRRATSVMFNLSSIPVDSIINSALYTINITNTCVDILSLYVFQNETWNETSDAAFFQANFPAISNASLMGDMSSLGFVSTNATNQTIEAFTNWGWKNVTLWIEDQDNLLTEYDTVERQTNAELTIGRGGGGIWCGLAASKESANVVGRPQLNITYTISGPDTEAPTWTLIPENATLFINVDALNVDFTATDNVAIDDYFINWTTNFTIDGTGQLTNSSLMALGIHHINVSVNDTSNNINSTIYQVNITDVDDVFPTWDQIPGNVTLEFAFDSLSIDFNASDNVEVDVYFINDTVNFAINSATGVLTNNTNLSIRIWHINVSVNDTSNNINSTIFQVNVSDTRNPNLDTIPANATLEYRVDSLSVNFVATDASGINTFTTNHSSNFSITSSGTLTNATNLTLGEYFINVSVNDTQGNINWTIYLVNVTDTLFPTISTPSNESQEYAVDATSTQFTATDIGDIDTFFINGSENLSITSGGLLTNTSRLAIGVHHINVSVNDTGGNTNWTIHEIIVTDTLAPNLDTIPSNVSLEFAIEEVSSQFEATDASGVLWFVNNTINFSIDITGLLTNATRLAIGIHHVLVTANDTSNNPNSTVFQAIISDNVGPLFTTIPASASLTVNVDALNVDFDATDPSGIDDWAINWSTNFTIDSAGTLTNSSLMAIGVHIINVSVNDTIGNVNTSIYSVTVNEAGFEFTVTIIQPLNNTIVIGPDVTLEWNTTNISDTGSCVYSLDGTANVTIDTICYQETANVSTSCGGLATGTYGGDANTDDFWRDGVYNTSTTNITITDFLYVNYSIPSEAQINFTLYQAMYYKHNNSNQTTNSSIPPVCWDWSEDNSEPLQIVFRQIKGGKCGHIAQYCLYVDCWDGTDWENTIVSTGSVNHDYQFNTVYEEAIFWDYDNTSTTIFNLTEGEHNITMWCNLSNGSISQSDLHIFNVSFLNLDGFDSNKTYEYGTTANITFQDCLDILLPEFGFSFTCVSPYLLALVDFETITTLTSGLFDTLFFRKANTTYFNASLPTYLDLISAKATIVGSRSSQTIDQFDDMSEGVTSKDYVFTNEVGSVLNVSFRSDKTIIDSSFFITSADAFNISVDICNDGSVEKNISSFFTIASFVDLDSDGYDCIDESKDISQIPLNITFTIGGTVTFSTIKFKVSTTSLPNGIEIDTADEGVIDIQITEDLSGTSGTITQYTDGTTSQRFDINTTIRNSTLLKTNIPKAFDTTSMVMTFTPHSFNDSFADSFVTTDNINTTQTNAIRNSKWDYYRQRQTGVIFQPSTLDSLLVHNSTDTITEATLTADDLIPAGATVTYYMSVDNGANFEVVTSGTVHEFTNTGTEVLWRADMVSSGADSIYVFSVALTGLGDNPKNLTVDINNDGIDYQGDTPLTEATSITFGASNFTAFKDACTSTFCELPMNISFVGKGGITTTFIYTFSTIATDLNKNAINAFIGNAKILTTNITTFNDSTTLQEFNPFLNETVYVNVTNLAVVSTFTINLSGGSFE